MNHNKIFTSPVWLLGVMLGFLLIIVGISLVVALPPTINPRNIDISRADLLLLQSHNFTFPTEYNEASCINHYCNFTYGRADLSFKDYNETRVRPTPPRYNHDGVEVGWVMQRTYFTTDAEYDNAQVKAIGNYLHRLAFAYNQTDTADNTRTARGTGGQPTVRGR